MGMERKSKNYGKIKLVSSMASVAVLVFGIFIPVLCLTNTKNIVVTALEIFVSISLAYVGFCMGREYLNYVVLEKCDFYSHQLFLSGTKGMSRFKKKNRKIKFNLLNTYFALGWYEQGLSLLEELRKEWPGMSDAERLQVETMQVNYTAETEPKLLGQYIAKFYEELESVGKVSCEKESAQLEAIVRLKERLYCGKWEDALTILESMSQENVYQQVSAAYWMGICHLKLGQAGAAGQEFAFAAKYGGNTKYTAWAQERMDECGSEEKEPERDRPLKKYKGCILRYALVAVILVITVGAIEHSFMYGRTVEETYRKYYNVFRKKEVNILYEEEIKGWTAAIICEGNKVVYCGLEHRDKEKKYRIRNVFRTDTVFLTAKQKEKELNLSRDEAEAVDGVMAEFEVKSAINEFYLANEAFREEQLPYVGVYCSPIVEGLEICGEKAEVEMTVTDNETFYLWKIKNADYKELTEEDIKIIR